MNGNHPQAVNLTATQVGTIQTTHNTAGKDGSLACGQVFSEAHLSKISLDSRSTQNPHHGAGSPGQREGCQEAPIAMAWVGILSLASTLYYLVHDFRKLWQFTQLH